MHAILDDGLITYTGVILLVAAPRSSSMKSNTTVVEQGANVKACVSGFYPHS